MWALALWSVTSVSFQLTYIFPVKDNKENEPIIAANKVDLHQSIYYKLH